MSPLDRKLSGSLRWIGTGAVAAGLFVGSLGIASAATGVGLLEGRLTAVRAGLLDSLVNLDTAISTRLAASAYVGPDNADILAIRARTDSLLDVAVSSRLATAAFIAPDNADIAAIKVTTDACLDTPISSRLASSA